jgi:hypothetical protein
MTGNFTFTYPTVYLAHHPVTATTFHYNDLAKDRINDGEMIAITGGVLPLRSEDVSSV